MRFFVECTFSHLRKRGVASRKGALCNLDLTEKRSLQPGPHGKAHSVLVAHQKAHSARERPPRLRLYVRRRGQNALFRRVRFSSPAQTWRRLTEKRSLCPGPHGKAHFGKNERHRARRRCARRHSARRHRQMPPHSCAMPTSGDVNLDDMSKTPQAHQTCLHTPRSREAPSLVPGHGYLHAIPQPKL